MTTLSLEDFSQCFLPDWEALLIYSDYFEDQGEIALAQTLRWLHHHKHWPHKSRCRRIYTWWFSSPGYVFTYYRQKGVEPYLFTNDPSNHCDLLAASTLPRIALSSQESLENKVCFNTITEAILYLSKEFLPRLLSLKEYAPCHVPSLAHLASPSPL